MAEPSELEDRGKTLHYLENSEEESNDDEKLIDKALGNVTDSKAIDDNVSLMRALSLGNDQIGHVVGNSDDASANKASEKRNVPEDIDDAVYEDDPKVGNKYEGNDNDGDEIIATGDKDKTIDISDDSIQEVNDPLIVECDASTTNDSTADLSKDIKKENPTRSEESKVKLARVVFDASDMGKDCKTLRLNAATPMKEIKKIFSKHLDATEEIFMMHFNDQEVESQTLLELFGESLDGDDNVIKIVKSVKVKLGGQAFPANRLYLDERPNTDFFAIRQKIASHLNTSQALIGLVYNGEEILNDQTLESVDFVHGGILEVIKKRETRIRLRGPIFDSLEGNCQMDIVPNTTMRNIKSQISRYAKEDLRKIMLTYKDREPNDQDTPLTLRMSDTDILFASLKYGVFIRMKRSIGETELIYDPDRPFRGLFYAYCERHLGKQEKSFKFRFNGNVINDEDSVKSLGMVDGDCIIASENFNQIFTGSVFPSGFVIVTIDTEMKFIDVKKHLSKQLGKHFKDIVFSIAGFGLKDDDTPQCLNIVNGNTVISVSIEQYIDVFVTYFCSGPEKLTFPSKIRQGISMKEWKSEISAELEEPVRHLSFMWEDTEITDLDTPELIGIQEGDTVEVLNELVIDIRIEGGSQVLDYPIHVDRNFSELQRYCSKKCRVGINSLTLRFVERIINTSDTPRNIGLLEGGTVEVFLRRKNNTITVEFSVDDSSLIKIFDQLKEFPLLFDICEADQMYLIKLELSELFVRGIDPAYILLFHNKKQIRNDETLEEIGCANGDKICIEIKEPSNDEKLVDVYVKRNMKETNSSMGNGWQVDDEEICAFKLDVSKNLSEFIRKVRSKISCTSKEDKLFLSFNDAMVNKDDLGKTLYLAPNFFINRFECHAFPNLEAFKTYLEENCEKEYLSGEEAFKTYWEENCDEEYWNGEEYAKYPDSFDDSSEYSFPSDDYDFRSSMPNYGESNEGYDNYRENQEEENKDFGSSITPPNYKHNHVGDEQISEEQKRDLEKKIKALQMRKNIDKKKEQKAGGISLAKDIQNHKDFKNVDDILKFIGEDLTSIASKENKDKTSNSKKKKQKNKKRNKSSKESDKKEGKLDIQESNGDDFEVEVAINQGDDKDIKKNEGVDVPIDDKTDTRNKRFENSNNKAEFDGDKCKDIKKPKDFGNLNDILGFVGNAGDSIGESNDFKARSSETASKKKNRKQIKCNKSDKKKKPESAELDHSRDNKQNNTCKSDADNREKQNDETDSCSIECNTCTLINSHHSKFCDACGNELNVDDQNWKKVDGQNLKKPSTKIQRKGKGNLSKTKTTLTSNHEKTQDSVPKSTLQPEESLQNSVRNAAFPHHKKVLQKSGPNPTTSSRKEKLLQNTESESTTSSRHKTSFSQNEKDYQKSEPKRTSLSHDEKVFQESDKRTKRSCMEEYVSKSIYPQQQVSALQRENVPQRRDADDVVRKMIGQVGTETEVFLERKKACEYPAIDETYTTHRSTSKEPESVDKKIQAETRNSPPEEEYIPVIAETEEETEKWCKLMVAARKRKDEQRKREYIHYRDMQSRNISPEIQHGSNTQMLSDQVMSGTKPVVLQPQGIAQNYAGNTRVLQPQGNTQNFPGNTPILQPQGITQYFADNTQVLQPQGTNQYFADNTQVLQPQGTTQNFAGNTQVLQPKGIAQNYAGNTRVLQPQGSNQYFAGNTQVSQPQGTNQYYAGNTQVLQPQGSNQYFAGNTQVTQPQGSNQYYAGNTHGGNIGMDGKPQIRNPFGPSSQTNQWPNPAFFQRWR